MQRDGTPAGTAGRGAKSCGAGQHLTASCGSGREWRGVAAGAGQSHVRWSPAKYRFLHLTQMTLIPAFTGLFLSLPLSLLAPCHDRGWTGCTYLLIWRSGSPYMAIHGQRSMLIADHWPRAFNLRWLGIHDLTHVLTIKSEIPTLFMNPE